MTKATSITAWFDGVCEPKNPGGHGAYGALVKVNGEVVMREGGYVGCGPQISNNVSEYAGVIAVMRCIQGIQGEGVIYGDSKLVVMQLTGQWKAKRGIYLPYYQEAEKLYRGLKGRIEIMWVGRDENGECDGLSKDVLRDKGIVFRLQRE
jgi:ribonuclease HI